MGFAFAFVAILIGGRLSGAATPSASRCSELLAPGLPGKLSSRHLTLAPLDSDSVPALVHFMSEQFSYSSATDQTYRDIDRHFHEVAADSGGERSHYWVVKTDEGKLVGGIGLTSTPENHDPKLLWWVDWFALSPEARGTGLGHDLFAMTEAAAREMRVRWLNIYTSSSAKERAANELYAKSGFEVIERWPDKEADGTPVEDFIRRKELSTGP